MSPEERLAELGIELAELPPPLPDAPYIPAVITGNLVWVSGHSPGANWRPGQVGTDYSVAEAKQAARAVGVNLLSAARSVTGSLDAFDGVVRMLGHVNAAPGMAEASEVINGCSELMIAVFGPEGRGVRAAVGVGTMPRNVPLSIEAVFQLKS
ncbi:MAG TPA: RidA family protein [Armatimonadota bacterium]|nr:RidA family protein [Armatimonadota bacterium]